MRRWLVPVLVVALVLTGVWGFLQMRSRQAWELQAENDFQRAFHELTYHVNGMENLLAKASVVNTPVQTNKVFNDIWRHSYSAQQNLFALPLTDVDLTATRNFLAKLLSFSYRISEESAEGKNLAEKDWNVVRDFKEQAAFLSGELDQMQTFVFDSAIRWVDEGSPQTAAAFGAVEGNTGQITKNFIMVEDGLRRLPDPSFDGNTLNVKVKPVGISGNDINAQQAVAKAQKFLEGRDLSNFQFNTEALSQGEIPVYFVEAIPPERDARNVIRLQLTRKGGHVLWMLEERGVGSSKISLEESIQAAQEFLRTKNYQNMKVAMYADFQNIAEITFVPVKGDVFYYPDAVKIQVARDNGQILAYDASGYLVFHHERQQPGTGGLTLPQITKIINPHLKVGRTRKAVIVDELFREVLCYEVEGTIGNDRFLVYINADNGREVKFRRITNTGVEEI
ncbi:MAG TPA: germination protein YpeB [Firmicutes bacterium]|jgi:germination protein YpeB|nr:germination protein YpeB [Bacillota bacterium]HAZ20828.1 germination protein YpeB [Bacillota bacterium]HBE05428.1 germination protein YpeB [Bacillota bacterium]HBG45297.1 germination protein YpeB [Bacillota bacterium]HBL50625.1 germination protein YpeB [Bacillota bacterium]